MGKPKGLCRLPADPQPFLARISALYREVGFPVAVATTPKLHGSYAPVLAAAPPDRWLLGPAGPGSGATVAAAMAELAGLATHLWLHPVDLPGVNQETVARLVRQSHRFPAIALVPEFQGRPGHPVVLPAGPFASLVTESPPAAMRTWLLAATRPGPAQLAELRAVAVDDAGVITDYDDVESLTPED